MYRVKIFDVDGHDGLEYREFELPIESTFPIGRSSRNAVKRDLMPGRDNAYIDSPVISRDHAVLSADADAVYLTDSHSMHGTYVDGQKIEPNAPIQLSSGSLLQFGVDVNRNEEFFVARKYKLEYHLTRPGFTVPDSDGEEDVAMDGTQQKPLTIYESDSESNPDSEHPEDTMIAEDLFEQSEEITAVEQLPSYAEYPDPAPRTTTMSDDYPEADDESVAYNSEVEMAFDDGESVASVKGSSEADYTSELDISDDEDEADAVVQKPDTKSEPEQSFPTIMLQDPSDFSPVMALPTNSSANASFEQATSNTASDSPSFGLSNPTFDSSSWALAHPPPLPPRPSAAKPSPFGFAELPSITQSLDDHAWFSAPMPSYPSYIGTNHGDRPSLFSPAPPPTISVQQEVETASSMFSGNSASFAPIGDRIHTPPATSASDVVSSTPPPPSRRTKVSIGEIVEDQPPTPTSVSGLKRKADVLEEDVKPALEEEAASADTPLEQVVVEVDAVRNVTIIAQRPKKQPRSLVSKLKNTAALLGYGAVGAVGAVAVLSYLPDAFFT